MKGARSDLRRMELAMTGLQNSNEGLRRENERLQISIHSERQLMKAWKREKAAELRVAKENEAAKWAKLLKESNVRIQQDCQRQLQAQREHFDREMAAQVVRLRVDHNAELRALNMEFSKTEEFLQAQIREIKDKLTQTQNGSGIEKYMSHAERERLTGEARILKEEKRHLEEVLQTLTESDKRKAAEIRKLHEEHQKDMNRLQKMTKQEGIQLLQTLRSKDREIDSLKEELVRLSRKRKWPSQQDNRAGEGGGMATTPKRGYKRAMTKKKDTSMQSISEESQESLQQVIKQQQDKINNLENTLKEKSELLDSLCPVPFQFDQTKTLFSEDEFSSLNSQDSGLTPSVPETPTASLIQVSYPTPEAFTRILKEHQDLQRTHQLLRQWITENLSDLPYDAAVQSLLEQPVQLEQIPDISLSQTEDKLVQSQKQDTDRERDEKEEEPTQENKETQDTEAMIIEQEQQLQLSVIDENEEPPQPPTPLLKMNQMQHFLDLSQQELHELREQNELLEFRVLELETRQQMLVAKFPIEEAKPLEEKKIEYREAGEDTSDLWETSMVITDHMNQLDIFLHSDADPSEKADAVQEWVEEALSDAWITPVCQHSLVRVTNVLRMMQNRVAQAESEMMQGPRFCGSLETILEEKEEVSRDSTWTQTEDLLSEKLVRQLEDELSEARHQLMTLSHENATLHEQLSNIHEQRTTVSATESELGHLAPSITGSDLSDHDGEADHDPRHTGIPFNYSEGPYDSIDSVPDKVRMEGSYLGMKPTDMVIHDFQESGIFEGEEDLKSMNEPNSDWSPGRREDKDSAMRNLSRVNTIESLNDTKHYCNSKGQGKIDAMLLRRMSSDSGTECERKLSAELDAKSRELDKVYGDVRQLDHCMDCLRLQLDGGTPCYPLGQGFTDILDKVRKIQDENHELQSCNKKFEAEVSLLSESQKEMAKELEQMRKMKRELEESFQQMKEAEESARKEASRLSSQLSNLTKEEESLTDTEMDKKDDAIARLNSELDESKKQLKVAITATALLSLWEHLKNTSHSKELNGGPSDSIENTFIPMEYSGDSHKEISKDVCFVQERELRSQQTEQSPVFEAMDLANGEISSKDQECQVEELDSRMNSTTQEVQRDREEFYVSQIQLLEKEKLELRKEMESQREDYLSQLNVIEEASKLSCRNAERAEDDKKIYERRFIEIEEEMQIHKKHLETLIQSSNSEKELNYREKCQLHQDYQLRIDSLQEEICEHKQKSSELENTLNALRQELEIVSVIGDSTDDYMAASLSYSSLTDQSQGKHQDVIKRIREILQAETTLRQKVYELEKKEAAYRETLQEADKIMSSVEARYCDRILEMETREEQLKNQLQQNDQNEQRLRQALRAATKGGEMFKVPDLLEKLIETENSEMKLREQVHRLEQEENAMRLKYTEAEKIAAELKEELKDQEEMVNQISQVQRDNNNLECENNSLRAHMRQVEELEETLRFYKTRLEELEDSEGSLKKRLEHISTLHDSTQKTLEQDLNGCKEELERTTGILEGSRRTNEALNKELSELRLRINEAEEEMKMRKQDTDRFEASNRHEISKLRQQLGLANEQLSDVENLNCKLRQQLQETEKNVCDLSQELTELKHLHEKSLLQLNLQLMQKDDELKQQEERELQLDERELDALCNQESELKNVELRLRSVGQDIQKCCDCGASVSPVLDSVIEDLKLLLNLICGEAASHDNTPSNSKNIDELESSCEDLSMELLEDERTPSSIEDESPRFGMESSRGELQRVASLEETLRRWEKEGDLLQAQLEDRESQIKEQLEEITRQQSVIEQLRERTVELYQTFEQQKKEYTGIAEDLKCKCEEKNMMLAILAREVGENCSNVEELMKKLSGISKGNQSCAKDYTVDLLKEILKKHTVKKQQQNSTTPGLSRRKSLCDLLAHVKWDSVRASSETCLLPPGSAPSKIPRYVPLQVKQQTESEKPTKLQPVKEKEKKKRLSLSALHRSKIGHEVPDSREESPARSDYRERSPLDSYGGPSSHGPQLHPPQDFRITRKVGEDSLILAWTPLKDENVAGYQILVNGVVAQHVRSPQRNKALLPALPLHRGLHLAIRALSVPRGNRAPAVGFPYAIRYDPRIQYNLPPDCHNGGVHLLRHATPQLVFETEC